jgi:prophage DNA circulation protein
MGFVDDLKDAVLGPEEITEGETWEDRLQPAAYTPPSGVRITFDYEAISYKFAHKTSVYEFPDADGSLVQDRGVGGRRFPWRIFLTGGDYDKQAGVFEAALAERGIAQLETPLYGTHNVIPVGDISRRDDLKRQANQAVFEVVFFKTIGVAYPDEQDDPANAALTALDLFGDAGAAEFASTLSVDSVSEEQGILDTVNGLLADVSDQLSKIAAVQEVVSDQFQEVESTINAAIDTLVAEPLDLAVATQQLIQLPGTALANISDRLTAYGNLAGNIFGASDTISEPGGPGGFGPQIESRTGVGNDAQEPNKFHARDLFAMSYVSGAVLSTLYTNTDQGSAIATTGVNRRRADAARTGVVAGDNAFSTAAQAVAAAEALLNQLAALIAWRDANYKNISGGNLSESEQANFISTPGNTDGGGAIRHLQDAVSLAAGFLLDLSFSLARAKRFKLQSRRSIVDLCAELYGNVDESLDFFINSNNFTGDEILEIPRGRDIVYYV